MVTSVHNSEPDSDPPPSLHCPKRLEEEAAARQAELLTAAMADPAVDVDGLVVALPELPALDPLADPEALSIA